MIKLLVLAALINLGSINHVSLISDIKVKEASSISTSSFEFNSTLGVRPSDVDVTYCMSVCGYGQYSLSYSPDSGLAGNKGYFIIDTNSDYYDAYSTYDATLAIKVSNFNYKELLLNNSFEYSDSIEYIDDLQDGTLFQLTEALDGWLYYRGPIMDRYIIFPYDPCEYLTSSDKMFIEIYKEDIIPCDAYFVDDNVCPTISCANPSVLDITSSYTNKISKEDIYEYFTVYDTFDFEPSFKIDGYSDYLSSSSIDTFNLYVYAYDSSGNMSTNDYVVNIIQVDDVAPLIEGPSLIYKSSEKIFTSEELINIYSVKDLTTTQVEFIDGDSTGKKLYLENASKSGSYCFRLKATDEFENVGTKSVDIKVSSEIAPVIYYDDTILVNSNIKLELTDFVNLLKISNEVDISNTNAYQVTTDNYTENFSVEGTHSYTLKVSSSSGNSFTKEFKVKVSKVNFEYEEDGEKTFIDYISDFFNSIKNWFWKNIFKPIFKLFGYKGN